MLEHSVLVKMWQNSYTRRLMTGLWFIMAGAAAQSRLALLVWTERPQWFADSFFYQGLRNCFGFFAGAVDHGRQYFIPAVKGSMVLVLLSKENPEWEGYCLAFFSGLGATLFLGGIALRNYWFFVGVLILLVMGLLVICWSRRSIFWSGSLLGRFWTQMTAIED